MRDVTGLRGDAHVAPGHRAAVGFVGDSIAFERGRSEFTQTIPSREPMEQREEKPSLFGLSRVATEEDKSHRGRRSQLVWIMSSRDRARRSQACLAMPSAADIQRKLIATEEDKANRRRHDQALVVCVCSENQVSSEMKIPVSNKHFYGVKLSIISFNTKFHSTLSPPKRVNRPPFYLLPKNNPSSRQSLAHD